MTVYPNFYPLGGSNGQYRSATTQTSSSTTVGTSSGNVGAIVTTVTVTPGATYVTSAGRVSPVGWVTIPVGQFRYPPPQDAGIKAGEITAYRAWYFYSNDWHNLNRLHSVFAAYIWTPGDSEQSNIPVDDCCAGSGFHAFKNPLDCFREYGHCYRDMTIVYGEVKLWGKVIEHELGYRAEFCKITKLSDILTYNEGDAEPTLNRLCKVYGVERGEPWGIGPIKNKTSKKIPISPPAPPPAPTVVDSRSWTGLGW